MTQYISKAAVVTDIDELQNTTMDENKNFLSSYHEGIFDGLSMVEHFINTLKVKEVDLEKESLTWEDIPELLSISEQLKTSWWFRDRTKEIGTQVFWEEVLKQFKAQKGE